MRYDAATATKKNAQQIEKIKATTNETDKLNFNDFFL
jgi:hypothetical protein